MPKWPRNYENANDVYGNNEVYGKGRYPISEDDHWHSGIHIYFLTGAENNEVYSFIKGELAAYRISKTPKTVILPKRIGETRWKELTPTEQELYIPVDKTYELKSKVPKNVPNDKYNNNFILLRHFFRVKEEGKYIDKYFFTLYTNIKSVNDNDAQVYGLRNAPKKIPFYCKYIFKVNNGRVINYVEKEGKKLFPESLCFFWEKDQNNYYCKFDAYEQVIEVNKSEIRSLNERIFKPIKEGVVVNSSNISHHAQNDPDKYNNELNEKKLATLKITAEFKGCKKEAGKFYVFLVNKNDDRIILKQGFEIKGNIEVYVRKTDIKERGSLNSAICNATKKGIKIYERRIASDILEEGKEFELDEPEKLLNLPNGYQQYFELKRKSDNEKAQSILLSDGVNNAPLSVRIAFNTDFSFDKTEIQPENKKTYIDEEMVLGYAHMTPLNKSGNAYYDVALIFKDINFMNNNKCEAVERYYIPPSVEHYILKNNDKNNPDFEVVRSNYPQIIMATGSNIKRTFNNHVVYYDEFIYEGKYYYLQTETARQYKINMLDWKKLFRVLTKEVKTIDEEINGLEFIKKNYPWNRDGSNEGAGSKLKDSNPNWYNEKGREETWKTKSIKRSIICKHHLEWDKEKYLENGRIKQKIQNSYCSGYSIDELRYFREMVEALDIWGDLKGKNIAGLDTNNNSFWFTHPVYFINHLDKAGLIDFNPYKGKNFLPRRWTFDITLEEKNVYKVTSNPGFAPLFTKGYPEYEGNIFDGFAVPTGYFNQEYYNSTKKEIYPHEGVDFRGSYNTKIISFISGQVIYAGWTDTTYGMVLIVANERGKGIYLLGHLSGFESSIKEGSLVKPNDIVAYVGRSSYIKETKEKKGDYFVPHLHVSYYDVEYKEKGKDTGIYGTNNGDLRSFDDEAVIGWNKPTERDPFNHGIKKGEN